MKIGLVNPGFGQIFRLPPLGLTYIASVLREAGYAVHRIETNFVMTWISYGNDYCYCQTTAVR